MEDCERTYFRKFMFWGDLISSHFVNAVTSTLRHQISKRIGSIGTFSWFPMVVKVFWPKIRLSEGEGSDQAPGPSWRASPSVFPASPPLFCPGNLSSAAQTWSYSLSLPLPSVCYVCPPHSVECAPSHFSSSPPAVKR